MKGMARCRRGQDEGERSKGGRRVRELGQFSF